MSSASRPPALRVPVTDVVSRASLVTPIPPSGSGSEPPGVAVVQRPVRIISDPPSAIYASERPPELARADSAAPASELPSVPPPASVPAPPFYPSVEVEQLELSEELVDAEPFGEDDMLVEPAPEAAAAASSPTYADDFDLLSAEPAGAVLSEEHALDGGAELAEEHALDGELAEHTLDADDPLSGEHALDGEEELSGEHTLDHEEDEIEVSIPPPAPPEALRTSQEPRDERGRRGSGEFEELEVETERAQVDDEGPRAVPAPPPPPPAGRALMPEPPDVAALARAARVQEIRPTRPRPHAWWEVFFDDDYLRTVRPPSREQIARTCDFIEARLGLRPGATLLDVGCGLGLHVLEMASRGYLGVGLDLSLPMLSRASEEAQARSLRVNFLHSDMREMTFDGAFDAVLCLGTTLGYFDEETNRRIVERLYRALRPGGVLLLDLVNRDHVIRSQPNLIWFEGDGCVCMEESEFNFFTSRLHVKRTVILDSGRQTENEYSLRLYSLHELGQLLNGIGFRVREVSGREALPGVFFGQESPNLVIVAERRAPSDGND